jgi:hypothetical protein
MGLEFRETLPEHVPDALPVYRLAEPPSFPESAKQLAGLASNMGLTGTPSQTCFSDDWTSHDEGLFSLSIHSQSGGIVGRHHERYGRPQTETFDLDDDKASGIASGFLERSQLVDMKDATIRKVTHLRMAGGAPDSEERIEQTIDAGVIFGRSIEGVLVDGPGGLIMINVDGEGEVAGFRSVWRSVADTGKEVKILDAGRAHEAMQRIAGQVRGDTTVIKASFGYFELGILDRQRFLQPAYMMVYTVTDGEVTYKSAEVVAAAEGLLEPLQGEKRFPAGPQPKREDTREKEPREKEPR